MELVLPMNFSEIEQEEMMYLDGGYAWWQYALVYGAIAVAGVGLTVALAYGQILLAASIMKVSFGAATKSLGIKAVAVIVGVALTVSSAIVVAALSKVF